MIKCHLSRLMGEHKLKVADVVRGTQVHRSTIEKLYKETVMQVDLVVVETLCRYFKCGISDLFEYVPQQPHAE